MGICEIQQVVRWAERCRALQLRRQLGVTAVAALTTGVTGSIASASLLSTVQVLAPLTGPAPDLQLVASNVQAAVDAWGRHLAPASAASLDIVVQFGAVSTATGHSVVSSFVGMDAGLRVFEQGAMAEIRTGVDPNGVSADAAIVLGESFALNDLWFDPLPTARIDPVPASKVDAVSVLIHELGHVLAFNGWRDALTGAPAGDFQSTFDQFVAPMGTGLAFYGPEAMSAFGGPTPLTPGVHGHLGGIGDVRFTDDVMNGTSIRRGRRYGVSNLDLAILRDVGAPVTVVPAPGASATWVIAMSLACMRRRRRR